MLMRPVNFTHYTPIIRFLAEWNRDLVLPFAVITRCCFSSARVVGGGWRRGGKPIVFISALPRPFTLGFRVRASFYPSLAGFRIKF